MLVSERDIQVKGEMPGESIDMSLDQNGLAHIMSVLTDLYSDKAGAAIREVITNALDSHIAADSKANVEVVTPNKLSPYFVVRDYGVGMSRDDIVNVVSKYGASTKRNSNKEAGMLGLGFKAPLTFTDQFTVIGIKNNIKTTVLVSRNAIGIGSMKILDESKTKDPNGVTIKIPVNNNINDFINKVVAFCGYVKKGLILDGQAPNRIGWQDISDRFVLKPKDNSWRAERQDDRLVMGNVSYPIKNSPLSQKYQVIYYADMQSVDFTPSREDLEYTEKTKETIRQISILYSEDLAQYLVHRFNSCTTYRDAWNMAYKLRQEYQTNMRFDFKGKEITSDGVRYAYSWWPEDLEDPDENVGTSRYNDSHDVSNLIDKDYMIISNFDNKRFSRVQARKINEYLKEKNLEFKETKDHAYLLRSDFDYDLIPEAVLHDWNVIKRTGVAKVKVRKKNKVCTWTGYQPNNNWERRFEVDPKIDIYYEARSNLSGIGIPQEISKAGDQFIYVTNSQKDKFLLQFPKAMPLSKWYEKEISKYLDSLTKEMVASFEFNYYCGELRDVDASAILDPDLAKIASNNGSKNSLEAENSKYQRYLWRCSNDFKTKNENRFPKSQSKGREVIEKYPLLLHASYYAHSKAKTNFHEHLIEYVNTVYKKEKGI